MPEDDAFQRANGLGYRRFLRALHDQVEFEWYMEIGCRTGQSLAPVTGATIAVDPHFSVNSDLIADKPVLHIFQQTSDAFFESGFLERNGIVLGFSFLDGMHLIDYLIRDFIGTERASASGSLIAIHDCCPFSHGMTTRDLNSLPKGAWTGDVWKIIPILQRYRPDLRIDVLDCRKTGLVVISNLDSGNTTLQDNYDRILTEYKELELSDFGPERFFNSFAFKPAAEIINSDFALFRSAERIGLKREPRRKVTP